MDLDIKKIIEELGIPEEVYVQCVRSLIEEIEPAIQALDRALAGAELDFNGIDRIVHPVKGTSGNLRIDAIYTIASDIVKNARGAKDRAAIESDVLKLKAAFAELKELFT